MSMTIKQAFEKLTMVCGAALKNPFFVQRNLHDAFADIAANIDAGGGGSTVEVTQVVSTGTKIATITVDDTPTDLYAPTGSSQNYSTTEHVVGKWIDGTTDVYEKTIEYTPESTISSATAIGTITNADIVIIREACGINSSQNRMWMLPMGGTTDISWNSGTVYLNISNDSWSTDWTFYVTVRYTKAS